MENRILVARWESKSRKHFADLYQDAEESQVYSYRGNGYGGCLGVLTRQEAVRIMQERVDSNYFQPDNAKTPMRKVK